MQPEAKAHFRRCATAWPAPAFALALLFLGLGTPASAQDHLKRLLIVYPDSSESHAAVIASEAVRSRFSQLLPD